MLLKLSLNTCSYFWSETQLPNCLCTIQHILHYTEYHLPYTLYHMNHIHTYAKFPPVQELERGSWLQAAHTTRGSISLKLTMNNYNHVLVEPLGALYTFWLPYLVLITSLSVSFIRWWLENCKIIRVLLKIAAAHSYFIPYSTAPEEPPKGPPRHPTAENQVYVRAYSYNNCWRSLQFLNVFSHLCDKRAWLLRS